MRRGEKGVYSITLFGDYDGFMYRYSITNSGLNLITTDPYGKGSTANGKDSVVIDFAKTKIDLFEKDLPVYNKYSDAVIYELNVRDLTIDKHTNIENKGKEIMEINKAKKESKGK